MLEQQNARVELQDVDATTMDAFLCYLYGGLPHMDPPVLAPLFRAADRFQARLCPVSTTSHGLIIRQGREQAQNSLCDCAHITWHVGDECLFQYRLQLSS